MILFLDTETFSATPINHGTAKYAEDYQIDISVLSWAIDMHPAVAHTANCHWFAHVQRLIDEADELVLQNSFFDRTVANATGQLRIPVEKIRDTMILAYQHSLPGKLDHLCEIFKIPAEHAKDKAGKALIQLFCKPREDGSRASEETHPEKWKEFLNYARLDVEAMRAVFWKIPRWNDTFFERATWLLDQRINDHGICIDGDFARAAVTTITAEKRRLDKQTAALSYGEVATANRRAALLGHLLGFYGVSLPNMQAGTIETRLEDPDIPWPVRELLGLRLATSTTSTAKYNAVLRSVCADGRLRGTQQYGAAWRTLRWGGRLFNPLNLPRPTIKPYSKITEGIEAIKAGVAEYVVDDIMRLGSSALRGLLIAPPGKKLCIADKSSIEGRMLAFLAGEDWKLQAYRDADAGVGPEVYKKTAGGILGIDPYEVDDEQRQAYGKVPELFLGFQGSVGAFATGAKAYGINVPVARILEIVRGFRKEHPATVAFWYGLDEAARGVIKDRNAKFEVGQIRIDRVGAWMRMQLPSGRYLSYPSPEMKYVKCAECGGRGLVVVFSEDPTDTMTIAQQLVAKPEDFPPHEIVECERCWGKGGKMSITYMGMNPYTKKWARIPSYGGKFAENVTQAAARDAMALDIHNADREAYQGVLIVHDELVAETPDTNAFSGKRLAEIMSIPLPWAPSLPLAAKGFETYRYRKD